MPEPPSLLIVGAGAAGLAAAFALRDRAVRVTVVEKSRGVSGRAATRWRDVDGVRWRYDHGAQYVSPEPDGRAATLLRDELASEGLVPVDGAVWPFDDDGTLRPDRARDGGLRWTYLDGIAEVGRRLRDATPGLDLRTRTRVDRIARRGGRWIAITDDGQTVSATGDTFDAVLLTPPGPQSAHLLRSSDLDRQLVAALDAVPYRSQFTVAWGFDTPVEKPADVYALVNATDHGAAGGAHEVAWLAYESDKPNRAPEGATLVLAQMSPAWTQAHYDHDTTDVVAAATRAVESLVGTLPAALWTDTQRWRYALPDAPLAPQAVEQAEAQRLFLAGDLTAGTGRVHLALEEGLAVADRIATALGVAPDARA